MKKYSAVVFDLDGTLLNTLGDLHGAVNHTLQTMGFPLRTQDEVRLFVGNGIRKLIQRALPENHKDEGTVSEAYRIFCNFYEKVWKIRWKYCIKREAYFHIIIYIFSDAHKCIQETQ